MVLIRLRSFTFMLMFTLLEARDSIYKHPHYQGIIDTKISPSSEQMEAKDIHQTILSKGIKPNVVQAEEEGTKMRLNGRKMASEGGFKKEKAKAKEKTKMSLKGRNSKISGATSSSSWNCSHKGKRKLDHDVLCNQSDRSSPKKAKLPDSFVALSTADYHFPNSHPPRHN